MPLRAGWYIKDRILLIEAKGTITDEEYLAMGNSPVILQAMDNSTASMVHYFFDLVDPRAKLPSLRVKGKTKIEYHAKDGWSIFINFKLNPIWRMTASILAQISQGRFRFLDTHEEALKYIRWIDKSLIAEPEPVMDWFFEVNWTVPVKETAPKPSPAL